MKIISQKTPEVTNIPNLHEYIILNILCFLPADFVARCRCVCKYWANLISQPYFPHKYFSRGQAPLLLIQRDNNLFLVQPDENTDAINLNVRRIFGYQSKVELRFITCQFTGWIVSFKYKSPYCLTQLNIRYHMYNPITGQHIVVQHCNRKNKHWIGSALVFSTKTNQLKLLEFCCIDQERQEAYIQTIGTNTWRSIGEVPCQYYGFDQPVLLNGQYHWFDVNKSVINSFNVEEEVFEVIHETPCFKYNLHPELGLLYGCLCLTTYSHQTEVWVMEGYGIRDSWTKFSGFTDVPFVKSPTCLKNGEVMVLRDHGQYRERTFATIICYDPRSRKCRLGQIWVLDKVKEQQMTGPQPHRKTKTRKHKFRRKEKIGNFKFF